MKEIPVKGFKEDKICFKIIPMVLGFFLKQDECGFLGSYTSTVIESMPLVERINWNC